MEPRKLTAREMKVKRELEERENRYWDREAIREDSHSPVGDANNMHE